MDAAMTRNLHELSLGEQLADLTAAIRIKPGSAPLRVHLAQLCMLMGDWERAIAQLQTAAQLEASAIPMAQVYREAIRCERVRERVFSGAIAPSCLGEPLPWFATLSEALSRRCAGENALADELQAQAFATADEIPFRMDATEVAWIADGDSRLGPVCEVIVNGHYYWLPFDGIQALELDAPTDLRDLVWTSGTLTLCNGGKHPVLMPSRYPLSHTRNDDRLARASLTLWDEIGADTWAGSGQRTWITDQGEHGMLEVRHIERVGEDPT